ncbi:MAG: hypothetical protein ACRCYS_13835 [Beijerinckiaceae bacterium]
MTDRPLSDDEAGMAAIVAELRRKMDAKDAEIARLTDRIAAIRAVTVAECVAVAGPRVARWLEIEPPYDGTLEEAIDAVSGIEQAIRALSTDDPVKAADDADAAFDNDAVYQFSRMMRDKMAQSRAKGRSGWNDPTKCSPDYLRALLYEHIYKGDPVDVANLCMMLRHYDEPTTPRPEHDLRLPNRPIAEGGA